MLPDSRVGAPGRGAPGRGACGRGIGRSTGCAVENGLLPTRGVRGSRLGRRAGDAGHRAPVRDGPGWAPGRWRPAPPAAVSPARAGRAQPGLQAAAAAAAAFAAFAGAVARRGGDLRRRPSLPPRRCRSPRPLAAAERLAKPPRYRGFHGRGGRFDEFALFAQPGENFLTGDTEFLGQLVHAGLACHYLSISRGDSCGRPAPRV